MQRELLKIYSSLIILGSEVNIYYDRNSSEIFANDGFAEGFYLHEGSKLVVKDIDDNQVVMGYPAVPLKEFLKNSKK